MRNIKFWFILIIILIVFLTKLVNAGRKVKGKQHKTKKSVGQSSRTSNIQENVELERKISELKYTLDNWNGYDILNKSYMEEPKTIDDYDAMVNEAINYLKHPLENSLNENLMFV
uniref:Uncharacterized protein n=1 Tax=Meloidogyne enterolobii TaxID=390850 RepID=A0A6V7UYE1_MELEN|nr:unnamed protein product [Meloidogyne enterolobii]